MTKFYINLTHLIYKIGAAAALLVVVILPIQIMVYTVSPPPSTAIDYFMLFQSIARRLLQLWQVISKKEKNPN